MPWTINYHEEKVQRAVLMLPDALLARYLHLTDRMLEYGPDLARIFYCTAVGRRIIGLHQFIKKTESTPRRELEMARRRMKEWKDADA